MVKIGRMIGIDEVGYIAGGQVQFTGQFFQC